MHVISLKKLREFWQRYPDSERPLKAWYAVCRKARWQNLDDLNNVYPHADLVGDCTVFNVGGNKYRLIVKIRYTGQRIFIRYVLTHQEYDRNAWKNDC